MLILSKNQSIPLSLGHSVIFLTIFQNFIFD